MITPRHTDGPSPSRGQEPHTISACPRPPPWKKLLVGAELLMLLIVATGAGVLIYFYLHFTRIIDARLDGNVFGNPTVILTAPSELQVGQGATASDVGARLRRAAYTEGQNVRGSGSFTVTPNGLEVHPGPESFFRNGQCSKVRRDWNSKAVASCRLRT